MRKHIYVLVATLLLTPLLAAGCASSQNAETRIDDAAITAAVKSKLTADPEINPFEIDVDTEAGVVRLAGTVNNADQRREAAELARRTDGVVSVNNEITLGDKTVGESLDDAAIVTKVTAKLTADPEVNPFEIDVDSENGVVTLTGEVHTEAQRLEAGKLARKTDGVREVRNRLKVAEAS
jgi:hyperosmotically inducible protein